MRIASVLLVEDDNFSRTLLESMLNSRSIELVGATASAAEAFALAKSGANFDVALLDLDLGPGPTGLELSVLLRRILPRVGIVFLTSYKDPRLLALPGAVFPVGARTVNKAELENAETLLSAILDAKKSPLALQPYSMKSREALTENQLLILRMISEGSTTKEIALKTGVSDKAVEASIGRIWKILGRSKQVGQNQRVALVRAFFELTGRKPPRG